MGGPPAPPLLPQSCLRRLRLRWGPAVCTERGIAPLSRCAAGPLVAADQLSPVTVRAHRLRPRSRPSAAGCVAAAASSHTDEQQKVEQQQEQQGGVQVEQHTSSRRERGASIAQHEAELQVEG